MQLAYYTHPLVLTFYYKLQEILEDVHESINAEGRNMSSIPANTSGPNTTCSPRAEVNFYRNEISNESIAAKILGSDGSKDKLMSTIPKTNKSVSRVATTNSTREFNKQQQDIDAFETKKGILENQAGHLSRTSSTKRY